MRRILFSSLCMAPLLLMAETHEVTVQNFRFIPNNITIAPGDTVRWSNAGGFHDVQADDGSWGNFASSDTWTFTHTFDDTGEHLYHCSVHSTPGRDITSSMNGRVFVQGEQEPTFVINAGLSGSWWNAGQAGQGFLIDVIPDQENPNEGYLFLAWFVWNDELPESKEIPQGNQRWFTGQGFYSGNLAVLDAVLSNGGVLGSGEPAPTHTVVDTMELEFSSCSEAEFRYAMSDPDLSGTVALTKFLGDVLCESLTAESAQSK